MTKAIVFDTEAQAARLIAAIDLARGPTEQLTRIHGGVVVGVETAPTRPWGAAIPLRDGRWAVPFPPRKIAAIAGRRVRVGGVDVDVPRAVDAVDVAPEDVAGRDDGGGGGR